LEWGQSWAFDSVLAMKGFAFIQTLQHFVNAVFWCPWKKFGSSGNSLLGSDALSVPSFCFLLGDLWAWLSKQCWGPFFVPSLSQSQAAPRQSALLSVESRVPLLLQSRLSPCFAFSLNLSLNVMSNTSLKIQACRFSLPPQSGPVQVVDVCCVFCTHLHGAQHSLC